MSTLVDWQLRRLAQENKAIEPFREEQLNPASYNLTIGTKGLIEVPAQRCWRVGKEEKCETRQEVSLKNGYNLPPGGWILVDVQEWIRIPRNMEAQVILRSSAARRGWDHALAGYVDPSYEGRLTLEFVNCLKYEFLPIQTGMQMVQLKFSSLHHGEIPERGYNQTGRYFGATEVEACKDSTL